MRKISRNCAVHECDCEERVGARVFPLLGVDYEAVATVRNLDSTTATLTFDGNAMPLGGIPFEIDGRLVTLSERIDMIFSLEVPEKVKQVRLVGDRVSDKIPPPGPRLWPSDHAGVVAELEFGEPGMGGDFRAVAAEF